MIFYVDMICKVRKQVTCEAENEEQVKANPWEYAIDEMETDQVDFEIMGVMGDKP